MKLKMTRTQLWFAVLACALSIAFAVSMSAQIQTQTTETAGTPTKTVTIEKGEVVEVSGNSLIVKGEDGTLHHFDNVPESARVTVEGKQLGIHDLKPGMTLERSTTTITTPKVIKTVKSVTGTVWHVNPPTSVILRLENGTNQKFTIPKGQMFNVDGQMTDAWGLKKGMKVSATKVTEVPEDQIAQERKVTGTMPPPPPAGVPILVEETAAVTETPAPEPTMAALPKTGSDLPLIGLLGMLSLISSVGLGALRHK